MRRTVARKINVRVKNFWGQFLRTIFPALSHPVNINLPIQESYINEAIYLYSVAPSFLFESLTVKSDDLFL